VSQARSLTVVLREPRHVLVPLDVAAGFPANALGRRALTSEGAVDIFRGAGVAPKPWWSCSSGEQQALGTALGGLTPQRDAPFADIAQVDGAAAMWAAVPQHVSAWLQMRADAIHRYD
jgi:hypothetical protein